MQKKPDGRLDGATRAEGADRKPYATPKLIRYGAVHSLTRAGTSTKNEGNPSQKRLSGSDRRLKENVLRVGTHPLGIGLYLYDYRPEFRAAHGYGRQLGVMADEVARVLPDALSRDAAGFLAVDYAALGISRDAETR
jgi:hypothetical protein